MTNVIRFEQIKGFVVVHGKRFKTDEILEKVLTNYQLLNNTQLKMLRSQTNFEPQICENCVKLHTSPSFFKDCQNRDCTNEKFFPVELKPSLDLFRNLRNVKCRVETAMWCQECRQDKPTAEEIRGFNKI